MAYSTVYIHLPHHINPMTSICHGPARTWGHRGWCNERHPWRAPSAASNDGGSSIAMVMNETNQLCEYSSGYTMTCLWLRVITHMARATGFKSHSHYDHSIGKKQPDYWRYTMNTRKVKQMCHNVSNHRGQQLPSTLDAQVINTDVGPADPASLKLSKLRASGWINATDW